MGKSSRAVSPDFKLVNIILLTVYLLTSAASLFYNIYIQSMYLVLLSVISLAAAVVPVILFKLIKKPVIEQAVFLYYLFTYFALVIGSALQGYDRFPALDKIMHFLSGFLFSVVGLALFYHLKADKAITAGDAPLATVFSQAVNLSVACIWEFYEYIASTLLGTDIQHVLDTGVSDTMQDMLVCALGGLITSLLIYYYIKKQRSSFLMRLFQSYYDHIINKEQNIQSAE